MYIGIAKEPRMDIEKQLVPNDTIKRDRPIQGRLLRVKITASPNKRMAGDELRRVMSIAGLTEHTLARRLEAGWSRRRIGRMMKMGWFDLHPVEMEELLKALGATSLCGKVT